MSKDMKNKDDDYPYYEVYKYVMDGLSKRGVTIESIARTALEQQLRFNPSHKIEQFMSATRKVLMRRDILNIAMLAISLDDLAEANQLPSPLNEIVRVDHHNFSLDEELGFAIARYYGTIATTQFGTLDVDKRGDAKRLDKEGSNGVRINTFIDDVVSAIVGCAEAKVMHDNAGTKLELQMKIKEEKGE